MRDKIKFRDSVTLSVALYIYSIFSILSSSRRAPLRLHFALKFDNSELIACMLEKLNSSDLFIPLPNLQMPQMLFLLKEFVEIN